MHIQHSDAEEIFINILYGLKYAHEKGAYHRDIKPENILFLDDERVIIRTKLEKPSKIKGLALI